VSEVWKPITGWEGLYEVSSLGRVRSLPREVSGGRGSRAVRGGRVLTPSATYGYAHVCLHDRGRKRTARVHVLVATAFHGARPQGMHACHVDGDSSNNAASNLYWGTPKQNAQDKAKHGTATYALRRGHCANGHAWTPENTYLTPKNNAPICRTCRREGMRRADRKAA